MAEPAVEEENQNKEDRLSTQVASHYNQLPEKGKASRYESRIFFQRNFNNWIKSICLADALERVRGGDRNKRVVALDLCCGKGGDLLKWKKGNISHLVCADIADVSIEQCRQRHKDLNNRGRERGPPPFTAEFYTADCAETVLSDLYKDPSLTFDISSCQFSFHYSFETREGAETMMRNACEKLRPGGLFVGSMPNGCELVSRLQRSDSLKFGNDVYSVTFQNKEDFPLFGCMYDFHLEGVVDCPEFLVYFPLFLKIASKFGMKLVYCETFAEFFNKHCHNRSNKELLGRMKALETYPPKEGTSLVSGNDEDYAHMQSYIQERSQQGTQCQNKYGTLSKAEWEASSLYLVFALKKEETTTSSKQPSETESSTSAQ